MDKSIQHSIIFYNAGIVHTSDVIDIFLEWTKFLYEWFFENETAAPINQCKGIMYILMFLANSKYFIMVISNDEVITSAWQKIA